MSGWRQEFDKKYGETNAYGHLTWEDDPEKPVHVMLCKAAGEGHIDCAEVQEKYNYPGGPGFGHTPAGSRPERWPVVEVYVPLPYQREDLRAELAEVLKVSIAAFLKKHNLEVADEP